ncbi:MAG: MFS transporter [Clostridia bacterium]
MNNRNEKLFQFYRIVGYDYLFSTVILFLFFTITKGLSVGQVMYLSGFYAIFLSLFLIPINFIIQKIGKKNSLLIGNICWIITCIIYMVAPSFMWFVIAYVFCAIGTSFKVCEGPFLYDILKKNNKRDEYSKQEGSAMLKYYITEAITAIFIGSLFMINNYLPLILTLLTFILAFATVLFFEDIEEEDDTKENISEYVKSFNYILKSKRIMYLFIFSFVFMGIVSCFLSIQKSIITNLDVTASEYSIIFAIITLSIGIGYKLQPFFEKIVKRKTLTFVSHSFNILLLVLGFLNLIFNNSLILLIISITIIILQNTLFGIYKISIKKYINNFTTHKTRGKILSVLNIFENIGQAIFLFLLGYILDKTSTPIAAILLGLVGFFLIYNVLKKMKTKVGLDAQDYDSDEILGMKIINKVK